MKLVGKELLLLSADFSIIYFRNICKVETPVLKLAICPLNSHNFKWSNALRLREAVMISIIQHFEADFL